MSPVDAVPIVGQPVAYALGFLVLILFVFTDPWAGSLVTVAHEGGHMAMAIITGRGYHYFYLDEYGGGATRLVSAEWGIGYILVVFVGYPAPSVLGLGGAALIRDGQAWSALWATLVLLLAAFFQAARRSVDGGPLAQAITLVAALGIGWVAVDGSPCLRAAVAVGVVWLLLIGGAVDSSVWLSRASGSDAAQLARTTLIPAVVWHALWALIGIGALVAGGRYLLHR